METQERSNVSLPLLTCCDEAKCIQSCFNLIFKITWKFLSQEEEKNKLFSSIGRRLILLTENHQCHIMKVLAKGRIWMSQEEVHGHNKKYQSQTEIYF